MKRISLLLIVIFSIFLISACGISQEEFLKVQSENETLKNEVTSLKEKLEDSNKENETIKKEMKDVVENYSQLSEDFKNLWEDYQEMKDNPKKLLSKAQLEFKEYNMENLEAVYNEGKEKYYDTPEFKEIEELYYKLVHIEAERIREERKRKEEQKKNGLKALENLREKFDDVSGINWYSNPYFIHYNKLNKTSIYIGYRKSTEDAWLRLKMSYTGENWIFFENAYLSYDGNTKPIHFNRYDDKTTDSGGGVWEWIDVSLKNDMLDFLENLAKSDNAKMRLSGKYTETRKLSEDEKKGILDVVTAYKGLIIE